MKQNISTLMDGELSTDEAEILLGKIKNQPDAGQEWLTYHLIGDAMRQPDYIPGKLRADFFEQLYAEPTVLAPHSKRSTSAAYFSMAAVASIMAMVVLAWTSLQIEYDQLQRHSPVVMRAVGSEIIAYPPAYDSMNDYLLAHHEYSHGAEMRGASSYIQTIAYSQPGVGK